jgi:hypothetical protein
MALFILPKYCAEKNIVIDEYKKPPRAELKKDKSLKITAPKVRSKKPKDKKKGFTKVRDRSDSSAQKEKKERVQKHQQHIDKQLESIHTYVCQIKAALGQFDAFVDQTQPWAEKCNDEEQLRQCDKALTSTTGEIERMFARMQERFEKMKTLYPFLTQTTEPQKPPEPTAPPVEEKPPPPRTKLQRKSSVVADRIWAELGREENQDKKFIPGMKIPEESEEPETAAHAGKKSKIPAGVEDSIPLSVREELKQRTLRQAAAAKAPPPPPIKNTPVVGNEPTLEELIAGEDETDILNELDQINPKPTINYEDDSSGEHLLDESDYLSIDYENAMLNQRLEEVDDGVFENLLDDLVITSPRDEEGQPIEYLQSTLERLKAQYADLLGPDSDFINY